MTRLIVRGRDATGVWETNEWTGLVAVAALAAQPVTLAEWSEAMRRYMPEHQLLEQGQPTSELTSLAEGVDDFLLLDLIGRTVATGGTHPLPESGGLYARNDDEEGEGYPVVWLDLPTSFLTLHDKSDENWAMILERRANERRQIEEIDTRAVLYGPPLLEYLAAQLRHEADSELPATPDDELKLTREIHAAWLLTARGDLAGRSPREVLLHDRDHIATDLEHRAQQWTRQGFAPPALDVTTHVYRYGDFGTTEIIMYFDVIREMFDGAWTTLRTQPQMTHEQLVSRLAELREQALDSAADDGMTSHTRRQLIESERRRMPIAGDNTPIDCDCPICMSEASGNFGPSFLWFDGHHLELEDEFAFSLTESREEWECEQSEYREWSRRMDRQLAAKQPGNNGHQGSQQATATDSLWKSSHVDWEWTLSREAPSEVRTLAVGFLLAELVMNLKEEQGGRSYIKKLNTAYKDFRQAQENIIACSAAEELATLLADVAHTFPLLEPKAFDLRKRLFDVVDRQIET